MALSTLTSWSELSLSLSLFLSLGPLEGQEGLFFFHLLSLSVFRPSQERQTLLHSGLSLSASPASVEEGGRLQEIEHLKMLVSWGSWNQAFMDTEGQMGDSPLFCVCYSVSLPLPFPSFLSPPPHPATSFSFLQQLFSPQVISVNWLISTHGWDIVIKSSFLPLTRCQIIPKSAALGMCHFIPNLKPLLRVSPAGVATLKCWVNSLD